MSFKPFIPSRASASEPFISLTKEGFRLSAGFVRAYHLERAAAVRLYFDRGKTAIGFHFPTGSARVDGASTLKRHDGGLVVRAQGFFTAHGIAPAKYAGRYQPKAMRDKVLKTLFVISLRKTARGKNG